MTIRSCRRLSIANEFASWGVDFLKVDGVGPGSGQGDTNYDNTPNLAAWSKALKAAADVSQIAL